jgi:hypothetical protein
MHAIQNPRLWLALLLVACVLAYLSGVGGDYFLFDDFQNIVMSRPMQLLGKGPPDWVGVMFLNATGPTRRPVSMLSFGLNILAFGMSPPAFKAVNLLLHVANGALAYALLRRIIGRLLAPGATASADVLALLIAGLWVLHPLHVSSVLYITQRMNILATTFTLMGLVCYTEGRLLSLRGDRSGVWSALIGMGLLGLLGVFSKETGAMIIVYALLIESFCFRFETPPRQRWLLQAAYLIGVALPLAAYVVYLGLHPESLNWTRHDFNVYTRLLSEARVVCDYLIWTFFPLPSSMTIFHDDITASTGLMAPPTTLLSILFLALLAATAWFRRKRAPAFAFGVAWFFVGHSLESTVLPMELVFEHRHYLPMLGPLLAVVCEIAALRMPSHRVRTVVGVAAIALVGAFTAARAYDWRDAVAMAESEARNHPSSSRSQYEWGRALALRAAREGRLAEARSQAAVHIRRAAELDAYQVPPSAALVMLHGKDEPVPQHEVDDLAERLRKARSNEQANPFLDLLVAASNAELSLSPAQVSTLFDAALANPRWRSRVRAMMYNDYGAYQFNVGGDAQEAFRLTEKAREVDPANPYFPLNLAKMSVARGDAKSAAVYLADAVRLDTLMQYRNDIAELQQSLQQ